uniref:TetR/AcrR family transcriptional regulator n=1 Tax=Candidatus Entotheonella palauensis TaxID=93172 RepID=UPI001177FA2E
GEPSQPPSFGINKLVATSYAGVNKGSFYHFFPSKQALVLAVIEAYAQDLQQRWHVAPVGDVFTA